MLKKYEEFIEKLDKYLERFDNDPLKTPLNPFIAHHYLEQTDTELEESLDNVNSNMKVNNCAIEEFKNCLKGSHTQTFNDRVKEQIEELEYMNNTNKEITIFIGKIQKERIRIKQKKQNSFFSKLKRKIRRNTSESV